MKVDVLVEQGFDVVLMALTLDKKERLSLLQPGVVLWEVPQKRVEKSGDSLLLPKLAKLMKLMKKAYQILKVKEPFSAHLLEFFAVFFIPVLRKFRGLAGALFHFQSDQENFVLSLANFGPAIDAVGPEIVFIEDLPMMIHLLGDQGRGYRSVGDLHEIYPEQKELSFGSKRFLLRSEADMLGKLDALIVTSNSVSDFYALRYTVLPAVHVIGNGVAPSNARTTIPNSPVSERVDEAEVFLYHGGRSWGRGVIAMLLTFRLLPEYRLILLGDGNRPFDAVIERLKSNNVELLGSIPASQLETAVRGTTAIVIPYSPSDWNTKLCFPNKLGDAINWNIPVVFNVGLKNVDSIAGRHGFGYAIPFSNPLFAAVKLRRILPKLKESCVPKEVVLTYGDSVARSQFTSLIKSLKEI